MAPELQVLQILARYVRATDHRLGDDMASLFVRDGKVAIYRRYTGDPEENGEPELVGELVGADTIGAAVSQMMRPHPALGWSHHVTANPIVEVTGDTATVDAQFIVFETRGRERPSSGWSAGTMGVQGTVMPIEAGYYRTTLRRTDDGWRIVVQTIIHDLPFVVPET